MSWDWLTRFPSNSAYIMENKMNLSKPMRIKFLTEEIELLKKRITENNSDHIDTTIVVLEDQLYVLKGDGLDDK